MAFTGLIPAAQYVRMSTEHQKYSILNQSAAIGEYAKRNGFQIVESYADEGRSGVLLKHRAALKRLLTDVLSGTKRFRAILIYDVSRWGRFQNCDESAHYEFLCADAGFQVHYCGEQFVNDGSLQSSIMKAMKRVMAAEFSREYGVKVYQGQKTLVGLGYKMGGQCLFGLRRQLVAPDGTYKFILKPGETKSLSTDRVVQVRGPESEVKMVKRLYRMALTMSSVAIVRKLNHEGSMFPGGKPWNLNRVNAVLGNIRYTGNNMWGRVSTRLYGPKKRVPEYDWIFGPPTFKPLVSRELYDRVQKARWERNPRIPKITDDELLRSVRLLLKKRGALSTNIIRQGGVSKSLLYKRFGCFKKLYKLVGFQPIKPAQIKGMDNRGLVIRRAELFTKLEHLFGDSVCIQRKSLRDRAILLVDGEIPVTVNIAICVKGSAGTKWAFKRGGGENPRTISLICRLDRSNTEVERFYVAPYVREPHENRFRLTHPWLRECVQLSSLSDLLRVVRGLHEGRNTNPVQPSSAA